MSTEVSRAAVARNQIMYWTLVTVVSFRDVYETRGVAYLFRAGPLGRQGNNLDFFYATLSVAKGVVSRMRELVELAALVIFVVTVTGVLLARVIDVAVRSRPPRR